METAIDIEHDPCSVRICVCVCMWMLVMCILFVDMALYARDMDIFHAHTTHMWEVIGYCTVHVFMYAFWGSGLADHSPWSDGQSASWAFCFSVLLGGIVFGMFFGSSVTLT